MTTDALKLAADKHMARAHGYKLAGDSVNAEMQNLIAMHLIAARKLMEACAITPDVAQ